MWARLRDRPLELYIVYRSLALTWAFVPVQVYYLQARGLDLAAVFDLNVAFSLATVLFEVPTGIFADRYGRRLALALSGVVMTIACAFFVGGTGFRSFAVANVFAALSMTLASGADSAYLFDYLAESNQSALYPRYEGLGTAAKGIGNLVAVLLGGVIYAVSPRGVFVFTGVITALAAMLALALPERRRSRPKGHPLEDLARASRTLASDGRLITVLAFGAVTFVLLRMSLFADQPHLEAHLASVSPASLAIAASLLQAAKEVGGAALASTSGALILRLRGRVLAPLLACATIGCYAVMGLGAGTACVITMIVLSSLFGLFSPLMRALMNRLIEGPRDRATLLSFESMGRRLLFALASPLFGWAVEGSTLHATFVGTAWTSAAAFALLGVVAFTAYRAHPVQTARPRASVAPPPALVSATGS